jgi:hypothetical protein
MTTEQKAKAYDKALESIKELYSKGSRVVVSKEEFETIFHELKESEDEDVRQAMINFFKSERIKDGIAVLHFGVNIEKMIAWLEKQGEQKPADNTEQKFHEGEWIIYKNDICQIVKREEGCNKLVTVFGIEKELVNERNLSTARLWSIQDAKPGDVLACDSKYGQEIGIVKKYIGKYGGCDKCFETYCFVDWDGIFRVGEYMGSQNIHPATKEQRDTLMKAMVDAGYTFDFGKKELKKIEEEYDGEDYGIDGLWHAKNILEKTLGTVEGYQSDDGILEHKCAISAVKKLYAQKPVEWSEEDEKCIDNCCLLIGAADNCYEKTFKDDCIHYLQNLKKRMGV